MGWGAGVLSLPETKFKYSTLRLRQQQPPLLAFAPKKEEKAMY